MGMTNQTTLLEPDLQPKGSVVAEVVCRHLYEAMKLSNCGHIFSFFLFARSLLYADSFDIYIYIYISIIIASALTV